VLHDDETAIVVADMDWARFAPTFTAVRPSALLAGLPDAVRALKATQQDAGKTDGDGLAQRLADMSAQDRHALLVELVRNNAAAVLGFGSGQEIETDQAFRDLGFDSLTAVELRNRLTAVSGLALPTTTVFDYPNALRLAEHLASQFGVSQDSAPGDSSVASVLTDLDRIGAALSNTDLAGGDRRAVVNRLRSLLVSWGGGEEPTDTEVMPSGEGWDTPDDVFQFIDNELGISESESE
jgi:acyl carrier protein